MRKIILSNEEIKGICKRIGKELTIKFQDAPQPPIFIGVLKGGVPFLMDLVNEVDVPLVIDFIQVESWSGLESTGKVTLKRDLDSDIANRDIVIVEDVIDSGMSMQFLIDLLNKKNPRSITVAALLDKKCARKIPVQIDYAGTEVGNEFLMGYGLDYFDLFRNTNYVFVPDMDEVHHWDEILKRK